MRAFGLFMVVAVAMLALVPQLVAWVNPRNEPPQARVIVLFHAPGDQPTEPATSQMPQQGATRSSGG